MTPLADSIRPSSLDEIVGQSHILGPGKPLRRILEHGAIPNMIFYGPSGIGKTTLARMIAQQSGMTLHKLNGTSVSVGDIKEIIEETRTLSGMNGILLYLDEIQYLNKKQQQSLLEHIENGAITLIASTTENPYFAVFNAIISRSTVFEFRPVSAEELIPAVERAFRLMAEREGCPCIPEEGVCDHIARGCGGDVRKAINTVELSVLAGERRDDGVHIALETAQSLTQRSNMRYDRDGDQHYDILSAFQKSIRGSDENAALHYLARLLEAGDLLSPIRRLLVIAAEDVGLAFPQAYPIVKACVDAATQLGLPEARIPLAEAVVLLCTAPKSNSAICAIDAALDDVRRRDCGTIPSSLRDGHYGGAEKLGHAQGYQYPHAYPNHYVAQQYLPDAIKDRVYYEFGDNRQEQAAQQYREQIRKTR